MFVTRRAGVSSVAGHRAHWSNCDFVAGDFAECANACLTACTGARLAEAFLVFFRTWIKKYSDHCTLRILQLKAATVCEPK